MREAWGEWGVARRWSWRTVRWCPVTAITGRHAAMSTEREKQVAAEAAAELVENGMTVGLGTGSTVADLLPALARRSLDILCAATSPRTEDAAREMGLRTGGVAGTDR